LAAAAATAALYAGVVIAAREEAGIAMVCIGVGVGDALSFGALSFSRARFCVISVVLSLVGMTAAEYSIARHYGDPLRDYLRFQPLTPLFWVISVLSAIGLALGDYDRRIRKHLDRAGDSTSTSRGRPASGRRQSQRAWCSRSVSALS